MTSTRENSQGVLPEDWAVCSECVGEPFLSGKIAREGVHSLCTYCDKRGSTYSIGQLADEVETALGEHFQQTPVDPSDLEYAIYRDSETGWQRDGYPLVDVIAETAVIGDQIASDIAHIISERHRDPHLDKIGEESPYSLDSYFVDTATHAAEYLEQWKVFEESLKREARFFSRSAERTLQSIFDGLNDHRTNDGKLIVVEAGPGKELQSFFRARVFQSNTGLKEALMRPDIELASPPFMETPGGRMNARGISAFYGATDPMIAIAEVRPPVGSRVLVGRFDLTRLVRLVDVEALRNVWVGGSVFDPEYKKSLKKAAFLERLSDRMTMPVMPDDEPFSYLATQAIADYLASIVEPPLDGMLYSSAQASQGQFNVVLFQKSSRVKLLELPEGTELSAHLESHTDDELEPDYWVFENVPAALDNKPKEPAAGSFDPIQFLDAIADYPENSFIDDRPFTLQANLTSLEVHHVHAVSFSTSPFGVRRHRGVKDQLRQPIDESSNLADLL